MVTLKHGARVLLYSDGISEALNSDQQEYGTARLSELIRQPWLSTQAVLEDLLRYSFGQPAFDDATVVLISARD
jgi:phosphoserine phosphatase RsbU/P